MEIISIEQMKKNYPDEWLLIGNPKKEGVSIIEGIVIFHSKDKREIAQKSINWRENFQSAMTLYTGEMPKNRKFWL